MEKGNFRRERLSELGIDRLQRPPERAWSARARRLQDHWHRFAAGGLERTFFAVACSVAVIVAIIGVVALATRGGGGGNDAAVAVSARPTEARSTNTSAAPTAITIAVPDIPTALPTETPPPEEDRTECGDIRGTQYRSAAERAWYEKNCGAPSQPPGSTVNTPAPVQPNSPPAPTSTSPPQGLTTGEAISLGVSWMTASAPKAYTVDSATCSAVHIGDHWIVSCTARLAGCQNSACEQQLDVCVFADRRVVSAASC
jgi:hypothetical protein